MRSHSSSPPSLLHLADTVSSACLQTHLQSRHLPKKIDQILEQCTGVIGIADDFCIHGKNMQEHNDRLHHFMTIARKCGLVLNVDKCSVAQRRITFFGNVYDEHGCHPDPAKVEAIHAMPRPHHEPNSRSSLGW